MVKGLAAVDWKKPENNAKLFAAVLASIPGTPDYKKIAAVFGPHVPAAAISYRLGMVRKEGAGLGLTTGSSSSSASVRTNGTAHAHATKRAAPADKSIVSKGKGGRKRREVLNDGPSDEPDIFMDSEEEESAAETDAEIDDKKISITSKPSVKNQKTIGGRVTKRVSPRKGKKTDYKTLDDPFVKMESAKDENGNNVFGEPSGTESEDTYATDGSFKGVEMDGAGEMEEIV